MKVIIITKEKDLISINDALLESSILFYFIRIQLKKKKKEIVVININSIKIKFFLKLIEFCKHKYINCKNESCIIITCKNFIYKCWDNMEFNLDQWCQKFIKVEIDFLIDLLTSSSILLIEDLLVLTFYEIAIYFIRRVNKKRTKKLEEASKEAVIFNRLLKLSFCK
jgi:hypothetical protein